MRRATMLLLLAGCGPGPAPCDDPRPTTAAFWERDAGGSPRCDLDLDAACQWPLELGACGSLWTAARGSSGALIVSAEAWSYICPAGATYADAVVTWDALRRDSRTWRYDPETGCRVGDGRKGGL